MIFTPLLHTCLHKSSKSLYQLIFLCTDVVVSDLSCFKKAFSYLDNSLVSVKPWRYDREGDTSIFSSCYFYFYFFFFLS